MFPISALKHKIKLCLRLAQTEPKYSSKRCIRLDVLFFFYFPHPPKSSLFLLCVHFFTCWSTATASRPSYMMLTHPSLHDRTNSDISACKSETHIHKCHAVNPFVRAVSAVCVQSDKPVLCCQSCISVEPICIPTPGSGFYW